VIEEIAGAVESAIEKITKKYYGVTVGRVINPLDPMALGRVQVQLPFIDSIDLSPWARVATPMAGPFHGTYLIPNVGDEVLVAFEHGDVSAPYIIGSLWNAKAPPPLPSPVPQIRAIRTLAGNQIVFTEIPPSIAIQTPAPPEAIPAPPSPVGPHQSVMLSPTGVEVTSPTTITLRSGTSSITITPESIVLQVGSSYINLTPDGVGLLASRITSLAAGDIAIFGSLVRINS
jgi:hypothetical protein